MPNKTRDDRGVALPLTIFVIAILTLMLGATFTRAATENRIAASSKWAVSALFVAQAGLEKYLGQDFTASDRPLPEDSMRLDVPGGWAWIVPEVLQTPADTMDNFRYIIRSTGYAEDPQQPGSPLAVHTVAQFGDWQTAWPSAPPAALIAANVVQAIALNGPIRITGIDLPCGATIPTRAAVWVPADTVGQVITYLDVVAAAVTRTPNGPPTQLGTPLSVADLTGIEWDSVVSGAYQAQYNSFQDGDDTYPSQLIDGNYAIGSGWSSLRGTGILIVTGNLTISGFRWQFRGIILVGGQLTISVDWRSQIEGVVITGLNSLQGPPPPRTQLMGPSLAFLSENRVQFNSCNIQRALGSEKGFIPIENTWMDNWATF